MTDIHHEAAYEILRLHREIAEARNKAIGECAKLAEDAAKGPAIGDYAHGQKSAFKMIANAIRALKMTP